MSTISIRTTRTLTPVTSNRNQNQTFPKFLKTLIQYTVNGASNITKDFDFYLTADKPEGYGWNSVDSISRQHRTSNHVFNIQTWINPDKPLEKSIHVSLWKKDGDFTKKGVDQIACARSSYSFALYNQKTGQISSLKGLENIDTDGTRMKNMVTCGFDLIECQHSPDVKLKAAIDEYFKPNDSLGYDLTLLVFDKDGDLLVPEKEN